MINLTYSQANYGITYPKGDDIQRFEHPALNGFAFIFPSVGLRGRF